MKMPAEKPAARTALQGGAVASLLRNLLLVVAGSVLLALSAKVSVPFYPVPMTLQTLAVLLIGATYGSRLGALTVLAYLAEGMAGLPVFVNTPPLLAGPAYFMGPTGGFLAGFVVLAFVAGLAAERGLARRPLLLLASLLAGEAALFGLGLAWLAGFAHLAGGATGLGLAAAFKGAVLPFVLGDLVKTALATTLIVGLQRSAAKR